MVVVLRLLGNFIAYFMTKIHERLELCVSANY